EKASATRVGIFLDSEYAREAAARWSANLERVEAKADPRIRDVLTEVLLRARHQDRPHLAIIEGRKKLERLRVDAGLVLVGAEHPHAVGLQRGRQRCGRGIELERLGVGQRIARLRAELAEALGKAGLAARRANHDGQELLVEEQPSLVEAGAPATVDLAGEGIRGHRAEVDLDAAADQMVVEYGLRVQCAPQDDIANAQQMVEDLIVLRLERKAGETHRAHQRTVAQPKRRGVDV